MYPIRPKSAAIPLWAALTALTALTGMAGDPPGTPAPVLAGCEPEYPPYCLVTPDGSAAGFSVDLLSAALAAMNRTATFRIGLWADLRTDLAAGKLDALPLVGRTPEREALYDFTFPYLTMHGVIVVRSGTPGIRTPQDLNGRRVAVMRGDNAEEYLRRANLGAVIVPRPSCDVALLELSRGEHDAVVIQKLVAYQLFSQHQIRNLVPAGPPLADYKQSFCFAVRKGDTALLALLNEGLSIVIADGTYRNLQAKWFSTLKTEGPVSRRIVVGVSLNLPPYSFLNDRGQPEGLFVDMTRAIGRMLAIPITFRSGTWQEIRQGLDSGEIDILQSMFYSDERAKTVAFSLPHTPVQYAVVTRRQDPPLSELADLAEKTVLLLNGDVAEEFIRQQAPDARIRYRDTQQQVLERLAAGEADCAVICKISAHNLIRRNRWTALRVATRAALTADACYATLPPNDPLKDQFDEGLALLKNTGEFRRIRTRWLSPYEHEGIMNSGVIRLLLVATLLLFLLFFGAMLWSHALRKTVAARTRELAFNNSLLQAQSEASPDGILAVDGNRRILSFNHRFLDLWGIPADLAQTGSSESILNHVLAKISDPQSFEKRVRAIYADRTFTGCDEIAFQDGRVMERHTAPITGEGSRYCGRVWFFRDVTESKQATRALAAAAEDSRRVLVETENARRALLSVVEDQKITEERLRESEERFRTLYDSMSEAVALYRIVHDAQGQACDYVVESVNPAYERLIGRPASALIGQRASTLHGDGKPPYLASFAATAATGNPARFESTLLPTDRMVRVSVCSPGPGRFATVFEDITESKRMTAQIDQLQRIESIGRLAGGIAHDFNNMLSVILGNTELALECLAPDAACRTDLMEIRKAAQRAADLTRQLLAFARKQTVAPRVVDLNALIENMLSMLRRLLGEDIDLAWRPAAGLNPIKIDPSQIDQVLANLTINAREAIEDVGRLTIETFNATLNEEYCRNHMDTAPGDYVVLVVSDTGCGMTREVLTHLFEPFFTTKRLGLGSGLGLATVFGIVKQNGGFINVYSEPGQGSSFKIGFPCHSGEADPPQTPHPEAEVIRGGHETVLLVEDEPALLAMAQAMLEKLGYRVTAAATPAKALELAHRQAEAFDLILSDIIMPGMNGLELVKRLTEKDPSLRCLYMSGYTANAVVHQGVLDEGVHFIQKPFSLQALAAAVRKALDSDGSSRGHLVDASRSGGDSTA